MFVILKKSIEHQVQLFMLAISFFTRIHVRLPDNIPQEMFHQSSRYFAVVGLMIGVFSAFLYFSLSQFLPISVALILVMASQLLITGAFHEDGWADVWDGFGGGWTVKQKLNIMKDSRLGTYGASSLFFILLLKFQLLVTLAELFNSTLIITALILAQTLSRVVATSLVFSMRYVSEDATSKAKPIVQNLSKTSLAILMLTGITALLTLCPFNQALVIIVGLFCLRVLIIKWFNQQLGGYTGDCLGAAQQLSEVSIYLLVLLLNEPQTAVRFFETIAAFTAIFLNVFDLSLGGFFR